MKKLMIALAAIAMAACAQAAAVQWQVSGQGAYKDWTATLYKGTSIDIATVLSTVIAEDAVPTGWTSKLSSITKEAGSDTGIVNARGMIGATGVTGVDNAETWTLVLMNGGFVKGTQYAVLENYNVSDYSFVDGQTPKSMTFSAVQSTGTLAVQSVPEPTSGLLLLLGVAGLALRRRRA